MTVPTITYGVGWQSDLGDKTGWVETEQGCSATLTVSSGTVFNIEVSSVAGDKIVYYSYPDESGASNIGKSTTTYNNVILRYRTSNNSIKAKVELVFSDASTQVIMAETSNTKWTIATATLTSGKTLDHVRLYATTETGNVYYDFISFHKGTFTFPDFKKVNVNPKPKKAVLGIPGSDTDTTQHLGRANTKIIIEVEMEQGKTWGGSNLTYGEYAMTVVGEPYFNWLTTGVGEGKTGQGISMKVMPAQNGFELIQDRDSGKALIAMFRFEEYDVGDASIFTDPAWYGN